jgi:hypothetical protein
MRVGARGGEGRWRGGRRNEGVERTLGGGRGEGAG